MLVKQRSNSSWWLALCIYVVTFFLVTLTFFQVANAKKDTKDQTKGKSMLVLLETSLGKIKIKLNSEKAPKTAENFVKYVKSGFYDGTIFHRVIPGFMVQGGGMTSDMNQKETQSSIQNEADNGLKNLRGTIAMARTNDPHSATAQFFINLKDNGFLDYTGKNPQGWGYAVFGEVVDVDKPGDAMATVDLIAKEATGNKGMHQDVPKTTIEIKSAKIME